MRQHFSAKRLCEDLRCMRARSFVSVLRLIPIAMRESQTVSSRRRFFGGPARSAISQIHVMLVMRPSRFRVLYTC
jgi:hypothetical protein